MSKIIDKIDTYIIERSNLIISIFVIATVVFLLGLSQVSTDSGTSQFTQDTQSQEALDDIQQKFSQRTIRTGGGQTLLINTRKNALSKQSLVTVASVEQELKSRKNLRIERFSSISKRVATEIDKTSDSPRERLTTLKSSTPQTIKEATRTAIEKYNLEQSVSKDYNSKSVTADTTIITISHNVRGIGSSSVGTSSATPMTQVQLTIRRILDIKSPSLIVFGSGIQSAELGEVTTDSFSLVLPVAAVLIVLFLGFAYRDPFDMFIGLICLIMSIIWTFGFIGLVGIPFTQLLVSVPPLLLAVGIDFGIHSVNRYREEISAHSKETSMRKATDQLLVAFGIVTGTTVIGFGSNLSSALPPIREFGLVAAIGICFTFLIFGIFLPSVKLKLDRLREDTIIPNFTNKPLGDEDSILAKLLGIGTLLSDRVPVLTLTVLLAIGALASVYGLGVSSEFSQDAFLPPEEEPFYIDYFPQSLQPGDYTVTKSLNTIETEFENAGQSSVTIYIESNLRQEATLEQIHRLSKNPPDAIATGNDDMAESQSILTVINRTSDIQPLIERSDQNNNGIPDDNLGQIYDSVESKNSRANSYITDSRQSTQIVFTTKSDATNAESRRAARELVEDTRLSATPTGAQVVRKDVSDIILNSALNSLVIALLTSTAFLFIVYHRLEGQALLAFVNMIPVFISVIFITATMRYLQIPLNALTATILSIGIGLGVDYTTHMTHRITDENDNHTETIDAINKSIRGTGGALFGSMITTICGIGSLSLAITPLLGQFGILISLVIFYAFILSILALPPAYICMRLLTNIIT
jgi:predicted RND superfamily exporter protein